eukprot:g29200.t1
MRQRKLARTSICLEMTRDTPSSALLLPLCGGSTIYGYKEAFAHVSDLTAQVSPQGSAQIKRHKLLRKEARLDDHHFREQLPDTWRNEKDNIYRSLPFFRPLAEHGKSKGAASLLAESGRISKTRRARRARARYLPQYPTGPATCDGSQCPSDSSVDPCSQLQNCSTGAYHDCQGSLKICLPNKDEKSDGSQGAPLCTDLSHDVCNGHYVADKDYTNNGLGFECALKDDKTCGNAQLCGVQNPPESLGEKQCYEPDVFKGATDGTCETTRTRPGHECKTRCYTGYSPSVATLKCAETGEFSPTTFTCEPNPCQVKSVQNALASGCKDTEGPSSGEATINSGESCTTQCKAGFYPSVERLRCHSETLSPATFTCEAACTVPTVANAAAGGVCKEAKEGEKILPFTDCSTQCAAGYTPSCNADPCEAPSGVKFVSKDGPCKEGLTLTSGSNCEAQCLAGYTPSAAKLACQAGSLTPATFMCAANPCVLPTVEQSNGNGCKGIAGTSIESGQACNTICEAGYSPSVESLSCLAATLTPATFACNADPCTIPYDKNQAGSGCIDVELKDGATTIESSQKCQAQCKEGYHPSAVSLSCFAAGLTPATWSCLEDGHVMGYSPSESQLTCTAGTLAPATFECSPDPCPMPTVSNQKGNGCKSMRGKVIASGAVCQAECIRGYTPSVAKLDCFAGRLTPNSYMCKEDGCKAVTGVPNAPSVGCQEGGLILGGKSCTPRCNAGYSPSETTLDAELHCRGVLTPVSFECKADSCDVPYVANSQNPTCTEGNSIEHNKKCTPRCQANYVASTGQLSCTAGSLSPSTFVCKAPCAAPNALNAQSLCKEGNLIIHGKSCTTQCDAGYQPNKASLECNDGVLTGGPVWCEAGPPPIGGDFYNCWTGDPHFVCRNGKRTDPLTPGSHWVLKQSCPGSPNFMWVQGLFGPVRPAVTMGNIVNAWKKTGRRSYTLDLFGTELSVNWKSNRIEVGMSYGVTYKATRHHWNRQNWKVNGYFYKDFYMNNQLWTKTCKDVILKGEAVEIHRGYKPHKDDRIVSGDVDMWQKSNAQIEAKLDSLTTVASLLDEDDIFVSDDVEMVNLNVSAGLNATAGLNASLALGGDTTCTGAALEDSIGVDM